MYSSGGDIVGWIGLIIFFIAIAACCCTDDKNSSGGNVAPKRNMNPAPRRTAHYSDYSYSECPSCGAPGYDGYCEECGYPDINQGWIGENY